MPRAPKYNVDQLRPMLLEANGNVARVAKEIDADSEHLRAFVMTTPILRRALDEVAARGVDEAIRVLFEGLDDPHYVNRLAAAKVFAKSRAGQKRGFSGQTDLEIKVAKGGSLSLTWLPPEEKPELKALPPGRDPGVIEGKADDP